MRRAGGWHFLTPADIRKRRLEKGTAVIGIELFHRLTKAEHQALEAAVQSYGDFLEMPATQE